jgi:hypothetical protein
MLPGSAVAVSAFGPVPRFRLDNSSVVLIVLARLRYTRKLGLCGIRQASTLSPAIDSDASQDTDEKRCQWHCEMLFLFTYVSFLGCR